MLDLACGTGTLTGLLARRGYEMIGVDASPEMLMQAMQNTIDCDPRPLFLNQRMEDLDLYGTVDVCLCLSGQYKLCDRYQGAAACV